MTQVRLGEDATRWATEEEQSEWNALFDAVTKAQNERDLLQKRQEEEMREAMHRQWGAATALGEWVAQHRGITVRLVEKEA